MTGTSSRQPPATPQQGQAAGNGSDQPPAATEGTANDRAIDRERLIWDPEYRREIASLLRRSRTQRS